MTIYVIQKNIAEAIEALLESYDEETGEVDAEKAKALDELNEALIDKLENCGVYIKSLKADIKAMKEEESNLKARRTSLERKLDRLESYVMPVLSELDGQKFSSARVALSVRHSKKVDVVNEDLVPDVFFKTHVERKLDKIVAGEALRNGETIEGLRLIESESLQVK